MPEIKLSDQPEYKALVDKIDKLERQLQKLEDSYLGLLTVFTRMK